MREQVITELTRRAALIAENSEPGDIKTGMSGSMRLFRMALAPIGYPLMAPEWMTEKETEPCMTQEEFESDVYESVIIQLFETTSNSVNSK